LAQRFTSSKIQYEDLQSDSENDDQFKIEDCQATAASLNMFGRMTRNTSTWYPEPLLCKRFNISNPHKKRSKSSLPTRETDPELHFEEVERAWREQEKAKFESSLKNEEPPPSESTEIDILLEPERPPVDLFKAIFNDDSESESDPEPEPEPERESPVSERKPPDSELEPPTEVLDTRPFISNTLLSNSFLSNITPPEPTPPKIYGPLLPSETPSETPPVKSWYTILSIPSSTDKGSKKEEKEVPQEKPESEKKKGKYMIRKNQKRKRVLKNIKDTKNIKKTKKDKKRKHSRKEKSKKKVLKTDIV
jgi:hypothetical protein